MKEYNVYSNYTAAYNDFAPGDLPRFSSVFDSILHAERIPKEFDITEQNEEYREYISEM